MIWVVFGAHSKIFQIFSLTPGDYILNLVTMVPICPEEQSCVIEHMRGLLLFFPSQLGVLSTADDSRPRRKMRASTYPISYPRALGVDELKQEEVGRK